MKKYRFSETALHHSVYEVEADSYEEAEDKLKKSFESYLVQEFWGETMREVEEIETD